MRNKIIKKKCKEKLKLGHFYSFWILDPGSRQILQLMKYIESKRKNKTKQNKQKNKNKNKNKNENKNRTCSPMKQVPYDKDTTIESDSKGKMML